LQAVGVANQTTMLRGETETVQRMIKDAMIQKFGIDKVDEHFRFFDTICGATQDRQDALEKLLRDPLDFLLVVGGYNSSNTSHLAEMGEAKLPTYFIKNAAKMEPNKIVHYRQDRQTEVETPDWLPSGKITVGITAGASCPNNLIEETIRRLFALRGISIQHLLTN
jgi:4-hydroxy-3-methylbut-2-enyl diphosphate reductase